MPSRGTILQPNPPPQTLADSDTESDEELKNNLKPDPVDPTPTDDSSPEIPPQGPDDEMEEDQYFSNIGEGNK